MVVLVVVLGISTACASNAERGADGVRERLNGYPDLGWPDSKMDRVGARVCVQFTNGVFDDPRVTGSDGSNSAYFAYVDHPRPRWIIEMAPWIWQVFFDSYCSET